MLGKGERGKKKERKILGGRKRSERMMALVSSAPVLLGIRRPTQSNGAPGHPEWPMPRLGENQLRFLGCLIGKNQKGGQ